MVWSADKQREWRKRNREHVNAQARAYYWADLENHRTIARASRTKHQEKARESTRRWFAENRERRKAYRAAYYAANRDRILEYARTYHANHREEAREYNRANLEKRRPLYVAGAARRRGREKGVAHTLTVAQWNAIKAAYKGRCAYCERKMNRLTQDHVVPISQGGATVVENIVPACRSCNSAKHTKPPPKPVRVLME